MACHDIKFHTAQLLEIFQKHMPHAEEDAQTSILAHLKALHEIELKEHSAEGHLKDLHHYLVKTTFPYYPFEDTVQEISILEALEKLHRAPSSHGKLSTQFFDFLHREMESQNPLRNKLQNLHEVIQTG